MQAPIGPILANAHGTRLRTIGEVISDRPAIAAVAEDAARKISTRKLPLDMKSPNAATMTVETPPVEADTFKARGCLWLPKTELSCRLPCITAVYANLKIYEASWAIHR